MMTEKSKVSKVPLRNLTLRSLAQQKLLITEWWKGGGPQFILKGPRIVFSRFDPAVGHDQIFSMLYDGFDLQNISSSVFSGGLTRDDETPAISPKTSKVAFARGSGGYDSGLWIMNVDGSAQSQLTHPPSGSWDNQPAWSNDGSKIAFTRSYQIWMANANGGSPQPVMDYSSSPGLDHAPSWNPAGNEIAFWREAPGGQSSIMVVTVATKAVREISHPGPNDFDGWPSWSPDGTRIAFWRNDVTQSAIWTTDPGGVGPPTNLSTPDYAHGAADQTPCWSPDSQQLAFSRATWVTWDIWTMSNTGKGQLNVSKGGSHVDAYPSWHVYS